MIRVHEIFCVTILLLIRKVSEIFYIMTGVSLGCRYFAGEGKQASFCCENIREARNSLLSWCI